MITPVRSAVRDDDVFPDASAYRLLSAFTARRVYGWADQRTL
jgi:hypothetical protein